MAEWMPVYGSSNVVAIRYHEPSRECLVKFTDGTVYVYEDVAPEIWDGLVHAGSKGRYVNIVLRRGYKYHRATEPPPQEPTVGSKTSDNG